MRACVCACGRCRRCAAPVWRMWRRRSAQIPSPGGAGCRPGGGLPPAAPDAAGMRPRTAWRPHASPHLVGAPTPRWRRGGRPAAQLEPFPRRRPLACAPEAQALRLGGVGLVVALELGDGGRLEDHVLPKVVAAHATARRGGGQGCRSSGVHVHGIAGAPWSGCSRGERGCCSLQETMSGGARQSDPAQSRRPGLTTQSIDRCASSLARSPPPTPCTGSGGERRPTAWPRQRPAPPPAPAHALRPPSSPEPSRTQTYTATNTTCTTGQGPPLEVCLEPPLADAGVDVVPGKRAVQPLVREPPAVQAALAAATLSSEAGVAQVLHHVPLAVLHLPVLPPQPDLIHGGAEEREALLLALPPAVVGCALRRRERRRVAPRVAPPSLAATL